MLVAGATGGVGQLVTAKLLEVGEGVGSKKKPFLFFFFCSTLVLSISIGQIKKTKKNLSEATASEP